MERIFGWNYQVLRWNLMCRSVNVDKLMFQHITWREDCLLAMPKCDQTGEGGRREKQYCNLYLEILSIIYHYESNFLNNNFYRGHPFWNSNIFTLPITLDGVSCINININIVKLLQGRILISRHFCPVMKMKATGIT